MPFEVLDNGQVFKVEEIKTETQTAIVRTAYGMKHRISLSADKTKLVLHENTIVRLKWTIFDVNKGDWVSDPNNKKDFVVDINGQVFNIPVSAGVFEFESAEPGEYIIKTQNEGVDNAEIKVVVEE